MRFRSSMLLLLCAVSLAIARQVENCQKGVDDNELIWEYDVRRPHRIDGYQVRFRLSHRILVESCRVAEFFSDLFQQYRIFSTLFLLLDTCPLLTVSFYRYIHEYFFDCNQEVEADYGPTNVRITCIRYNSLSDEDNSAIWIASGGIGHNFVKLKFRSKYSRGFHYRVFVYGQPLRSSLSR